MAKRFVLQRPAILMANNSLGAPSIFDTTLLEYRKAGSTFPVLEIKDTGRKLRLLSVQKRQMRELSKRVTRRKDISKSRKLCLMSVRIRRFAGR